MFSKFNIRRSSIPALGTTSVSLTKTNSDFSLVPLLRFLCKSKKKPAKISHFYRRYIVFSGFYPKKPNKNVKFKNQIVSRKCQNLTKNNKFSIEKREKNNF